jgi:hypothetical protein
VPGEERRNGAAAGCGCGGEPARQRERETERERERKHARVLVRKRGKAVWAGVDSIYPWACFNRGGENFLLLETWALVALRTTTFLCF